MYLRFLILISLFSFGIYWTSIRIQPKDISTHEHLVQESAELRTRHALEEKPALQKRLGVQKDIWSQNETRHFQIQSETSLLTIGKTGVFEELQKIHSSADNDLVLDADEGVYLFPSCQFTYKNPQGIIPSEGIRFSAKKLNWDQKEGNLHLTDDVTIAQSGQFTLKADHGVLTLNQYSPTLLVLTDNVQLLSSRIQDKDSYALADRLTYNPTDKTLLFSAEKKVLFWQEGLHLSASEVLICENQTVEGRGDVHFSFDLEEQNYIDELFKPYL